MNPALAAVTGLSVEDLLQRTSVDLVHPADRERLTSLVARALAEPRTAVGAEVRLLEAEGTSRSGPRTSPASTTRPLVTQMIDVSERRGLEIELRHQAEHDGLTELLIRRGFQGQLAR